MEVEDQPEKYSRGNLTTTNEVTLEKGNDFLKISIDIDNDNDIMLNLLKACQTFY